MDIATRINAAPDLFSYFQKMALTESAAAGHAFSRDVVEAAYVLCSMRIDNNLHQPLKMHNQASCINASIESAVPVAIVRPQMATNSCRAITPEDPLMLPEDARAKYEESDRRNKARAKYEATEKSKRNKARCRARYFATEKGKTSKARYAASDKGKKTRARARAKYEASVKGKTSRARYYASDKYKKTLAKYHASPAGRMVRAISNAKSNTYRSALKKGISDKVARQLGELAANAIRAEFVLTPGTKQPDS